MSEIMRQITRWVSGDVTDDELAAVLDGARHR